MPKKSIALLLLLLAVAGCGDSMREDGSDTQRSPEASKGAPSTGMPQSMPPGEAPAPPREDGFDADSTGTGSGATSQPQIIRTGEISLRVESLDSSARALGGIVTSAGGYIAGSTRSGSRGSALTGTFEVRVPSARFDAVLEGVRHLGSIELETVTASDVTEEYIDLGARLSSQKQLEARILKLLEERPGKLADVVEIEQKLAEVRSTIEGIEGRMRYLTSRVAHSSLTVRMTEPGAIGTSETDTFGGRMSRAFDEGTEALVGLLAGLLTVIMALLPLIILAAVAWWIVRRVVRKRRERREVK
jgi:hypothetical protein